MTYSKLISVDNYIVTMRKPLWSDEDIALARAMWFDVNEHTGLITADMRVTFRRALMNFIQHAYPFFMNGEHYALERDYLTKEINTRYLEMTKKIMLHHASILPYYDRFWKHQKQALAAMHYRRCTMLSLEQRMGKTITAASFSVIHNIPRTLVVTYNIGKWNWMYDVTEWGGDIPMLQKDKFTILSRNKSGSLDAFHERFLICNYDSLSKYYPRIIDGPPIGHVIFSEAQRLKGHTTQTFKAAKKIADTYPDARITFESGTPITNRYNDAFAYFNIARHPLGESYSDFRRKYVEVNSKFNSVVGNRNMTDLQVKMSNFIFRKTQAECTDMPPHRKENIYFDINEEYSLADGTVLNIKAEYDKMVREAMAQTGRRVFESMIFSVNRLMALAKIKGVIEHAEMLIEAGEKVVIFTDYKDPIKSIAHHFGVKAVVIDGDVSDKDKVDNARKFMYDPAVMVAVCNYKAAGHTIDLSVSCHVILLNLPLSPKTIYQASDRVKNLSKSKHSHLYFCIVRDQNDVTIDERLLDLVSGKDSDINALIDGKESGHMQSDVIATLFQQLRDSMEEKGIIKNTTVQIDNQ